MNALIDITPRITTPPGPAAPIAVFPGDTPPTRDVLLDMHRGDHITLSAIRTTVHLGAHADGENHYKRAGRPIDQMPLECYIGPCHVVTANVRRTPGGARITANDLAAPIETLRHPRILIRSRTVPDRTVFNDDYAGLDPALIDALAARTGRGGSGGGGGVITIGIDTPSVDVADSKDLPAHKAIAQHGIAILEGLNLDDVEDGDYELIALPLNLVGFDASPVRAILRRLG